MDTNKLNKENISPTDIDKLTVVELKDFLRFHNQPVSGRSAELKERAKGALALRIPDNSELRLIDERNRQKRNLTKFRTPLGESLPDPVSFKSGWTSDIINIPDVTEKELYNYLVFNSGRTFDGEISGASKQIKAKVFYEDNHVFQVEYHPLDDGLSHGYVRCKVMPSMPSADVKKDPDYVTWVSLSKLTGQIHAADCTCTAGEGETCNHVAALLWGLVDITTKKGDGTIASTSLQCKWNQPRKRKLSPKRAEHMLFQKVLKQNNKVESNYRDFAPVKKNNSDTIDRNEFRKKMIEVLPKAGFHKLFQKEKIPEEVLKKNVMPEPDICFHRNLDVKSEFAQSSMTDYVAGLDFDPSEVEETTRGQRNNELWYISRNKRITASNFGMIFKADKSTSAVKTVMGYYKSVSTDALEWGKKREKAALNAYISKLKSDGHSVEVEESGLVLLPQFPFIGASPDGVSIVNDEIGLVEIKCPYKYRQLSPEEAAQHKDFCCELKDGKLVLKRNHNYYFQIIGQMALKKCDWCDFVIWTTKGLHIERVYFDRNLWSTVLQKLLLFYRENVIPEIFSCRIKQCS